MLSTVPNRPSRTEPTDELLAAERAGTEYWREVARHRRVEAARVQRRPIVRAAIALDRRTAGVQRRAADLARSSAATGRRAALTAQGWRRRAELAVRRSELDAELEAVEGLAAPADPRRRVLIELTDSFDPHEVDAEVAASDAELVVLVGPTVRPLTADWFDRLAAEVQAPVVAAAPIALHPERPATQATADDLLVRWAGLEVVVGPDGAPRPVGSQAGTAPDLTTPSSPIASAATAVVVDRSAWLRAGGLGAAADGPMDLDGALVDLCTRLRAGDGEVVVVPAAAVIDDRPVRSAADLAGPISPASPAWASVVDRHGPALVRAARGEQVRSSSFAITTATPSAKMAPFSGDWHFAELFARALRRAGHDVAVRTLDGADSLAARSADVHVVLRGLEPVRRTPGQAHVLWVISHPEALDPTECDDADLVLVASHRYAEHLRTLTTTPVEVFLQATDPLHFRPVPPDPAHRHEVTVVANSRGVARSAVADAVAAGLHPAIHGMGWEGLVDPALVCAPYADIEHLPAVYCSADVVLNDHWETMRRWGFLSNRILDVAACGTPVASDRLPEVAELFGDLVPTWERPEELQDLVAALRRDPAGTRERAEELRRVVLDAHTFDHRATELAGHLQRHGLAPS